MKQARQYEAAGDQQADKQNDGLAQGDRQRPIPGLFAAAGKHRYQRQQQYGHHILEQQHANRVLAVGAENFPQAGQLFADYGRGRQGQACAQQKGAAG